MKKSGHSEWKPVSCKKWGVGLVLHLHLEERQKIVRRDSNSDGLDLEEPARDENKDSEVIFMFVVLHSVVAAMVIVLQWSY